MAKIYDLDSNGSVIQKEVTHQDIIKHQMSILTYNLKKYAELDLEKARKFGLMAIVGLKVGNVEIAYNNGQYTIVDFNNSELVHYAGAKKGAIEFLVNNYEVIHE